MPENIPLSNRLLSSAGINPYEQQQSNKVEPPPFLQNDISKQLNANVQKPLTDEEYVAERGMKWLGRSLGRQDRNAQMTPYTYNAGAGSNSFYKRYHAFGQKTFDEIGFSPFKNNDEAFNAQTSFLDRTSRSIVHGFAPLFARGFVSGPKSMARMLQGDFGDDPEDARKYAEAAAIAQDTSGGVGAFFNNSLMNFGYSAGIITEAIAEELALSAMGGIGGAANLPRFFAKLGKAASGVKGFSTVVDTAAGLGKSIKSLTNVNKAREFFNAAKIEAGLETRLGKFANFFNPAENLLETGLDIAKNTKQLKGWQRFNNATFKTAGALYRDVRNINMALSEARLEGGFARNDTFDQLFNDYRSKHNGQLPSEEMRNAMMKEANEASKHSLLANTLLIYTSNKITFGNVVNPKSGLSRVISKRVAEVQKMAGRTTIREFTKRTLASGKELLTPKLSTVKGIWATAKKQGVQKAVKGVIGYTKANLMEGAQEVLQEVIADTAKNYHLQAFYSQPVGEYMYTKAQLDAMKEKGFSGILGEAFEKQRSWQGLETFASGFVMGAFASPLNRALPFAQEKYMQIFKNEQYKANKDIIDNYVNRMTKSVNDTFAKNPIEFYNSRIFGLGTQTELANVIDGGDAKSSRDGKDEATIKSITDLIKMDSLNIWTDYMESLKELTTEEYAEAAGISVEEAQGHTEKLDKVINRAKEIEKTYNQYNKKFPNPIDLNDYEKGTKEYEKAEIYHTAWEEGKKNVIFYHENYKDTLTRMQSIFQSIAEEKLLGKIDPNRVQALFKDDKLAGEIQILESEVEGLRGMTDPVSKRKFKETERTLGVLKEYQQDYENFMDHFFESGMVEEVDEEGKVVRTELDNQVINKLESSFKSYMKALAKQSDDIILDDSIDDAFEKLIDYYKLGREANKLSDTVNMLNNPEGFMDHIEKTYDWMYEMWNNREEYIRDNINKQLETLKFNQLLNDMAAVGVYVDLNAFAEFKNTGVIPTEFFDNVNKRVIKKGSPLYEQVANRFQGLAVMQQILEANKPTSEKQKEELARLDAEEAAAIARLPKVSTKLVVRNIDNKEDFSLRVVNDQLSEGQSVDVTYEEDSEQKSAVFYKDANGVLRYDNEQGEPVDLKLSVKFNSGQIFEIQNRPTDEDVAEVKKQYDALRAEAAEKFIDEGIKPFTAEDIAELDAINADTPVEAMPADLRQQLVDAYDDYRERPENKNMFPASLTEEDLQNKFQIFIKSESEALEIIEKYVKDKKLEAATTPAGEVIVPKITLPNGEVISADEATDAILDATLQRYRMLIAELSSKGDEMTDDERKNLAIYKSKANILSGYIENKRIGEMSPELKAAKAKIDLLLKEQDKIKKLKTGYDVEGDILRRVSNVIEVLKDKKYEYPRMQDIRVIFNMTIGAGGTVSDFMTQLKNAKLPGFSEDTYDALEEDIKEFMTLTSITDQDVLKLQLEGLKEDLKVEEGEFGNPERALEIRNQIATLEKQVKQEAPTTNQADIEAQKADIEKRREEDLKIAKRKFEFLNKEFIPKLEENTNVLIEQYDFQKSELLKKTGDLNYVESKYGKTFEDWIPLQIKWLKENKSHLLVDSRNSESRDYKTLRLLQEKNDAENKINAEYDAELAALEQPANQAEINAKKAELNKLKETKENLSHPYDKLTTAAEKANWIEKNTRVVRSAFKTNEEYINYYETNRNKFINAIAQGKSKVDAMLAVDSINVEYYSNPKNEKALNEDYADMLRSYAIPLGLTSEQKAFTSAGKIVSLLDGVNIKIDELTKEIAELEKATTAPAVEASVSYEDLVAKSRSEVGVVGPNLSFIFFGNLQNAIKNGQVRSKEELNKIIADWNDSAGYQGYPNEMSDAQSNMLLQLSAGLPDVTPAAVKKAEQTPDTLLQNVEGAVTERTYNEETDAGTYIDDLSKDFLEGKKPKFEPEKISEEAYENLFGENGLFQIMKQWMDTNKLIIVSRGLVVYDKDANVAGEIDYLLSDGKNFYIVDLKTGKKDKWDNYNDPKSEYYGSKISNTLQQASYVNLLYNMIGVKAIPKILPVELELNRSTGKILKASRPSSPNALKVGKILIDLPVSPEIQAKIDELIPLRSTPSISSVPLSPSVSNIVNKAEGEQVEPTDYEEGSDVPTGTLTDASAKVKEYEDKINKAEDTDKLDFIELQLGMNSVDMTADDIFKVQQMIEQRRNILLSGGKVVTQEKSWSTGNQVYSESTIFVDKGKNRGEVFLEPFETAIISSIDAVKGTVTIKPYGKKNQKTISIDMLNKMFKLNSDLFTGEEAPAAEPAGKDLQNLSKESTDVVSTLLNDTTEQARLESEVSDESITVDKTVDDLLDDLEC